MKMKTDILEPMFRRVGSAVAGFLVANGVIAQDMEAAVGSFVVAIAAVAADLLNSYQGRKRRRARRIQSGVARP